MSKRRSALLGAAAGAVGAAALCAAVCGAQLVSPANAASFLGALLCAPTAALPAARAYLDDATAPRSSSSGAAGDAEDSEDAVTADAGFWTQLPSAGEIAAAQSAAVSPAEEAAGETASEPVEIPAGMVAILPAHYEQGKGQSYLASGAATVKNCTGLAAEEVAAEMMQPLPFSITANSSEPQVLIVHTHATETYELEDRGWTDPAFSARSTDVSVNMVAVGAAIADQLNAAGVNTLHCETLHDYPSYTGSYEKSHATVEHYLAQYPSIKVVLDVHRDAIQQEDGTRIKPVAQIEGRQAAQVMLICGADDGGNLPNFRQNLRFASRFQNTMERLYPGLTRPVLLDYRYYNQDLSTGSLLLEVGGHANTLAEALYSGQLVGKALAALLTQE